MTIGRDDYGIQHVNLDEFLGPDGRPGETEKIDDLWALISIHPGGGEGIYGQNMPGPVEGIALMVQFIASNDQMKQMFDTMLTEQGTYEVAAREGVKLEWRYFKRG